MAGQNQPGIIVTQAGVSAPYAADYQMVFNSNWPSLQCSYDSTQTVGASSSLSFNHALNIYPFTVVTVLSAGNSLGRSFGLSKGFDITPPAVDISYNFDTTNVYVSNANVATSYQVNVKCYNLDITKSVDYTLPKPPINKTAYDPTYGIKVVKYGKSIGSTDLRDFILHSRAQAPAVLSVVTQSQAYTGSQTSFGTTTYFYDLVYVNPANYTPWAFAFYDSGNGKFTSIAPGGQQASPSFQLVTNVSTYLTQVTQPGLTGNGAVLGYSDSNPPASSSIRASIVMLRDPLIIATTKQVQYG